MHDGDIGADQQKNHGIGEKGREFPEIRHGLAAPAAEEGVLGRAENAEIAHDQARR